MNFVCSRNAFADAVTMSQFGLTPRSAVPGLTGVRLSTKASRLTLETTNLDRAARCEVPLQSVARDGVVVLSGTVLGQITARLPEDEWVELRADRSQMSVRLTCGSATFDLPRLPAETFPHLPSLPRQTATRLPIAELHRGVELTGFATFKPSETTRQSLTAIALSLSDGVFRMMGCNGHRLAIRSMNVDADHRETDSLVEARTLVDLDRTLAQTGAEEISVRQAEGQIFFSTPASTFMARTIPEEFPRFDRIVPQQSRVKLSFDRSRLLDALQRIAITSAEDSEAILFRGTPGSPEVRVSSSSRERGDSSELVPLLHAQTEPIQIAFKASYIIDALRRLKSMGVVFQIQSSEKACLIEPGGDRIDDADLGFIYVCMPVLISNESAAPSAGVNKDHVDSGP